MPLDDLQSAVFAAIRGRRNPDSHVAGATALHRDPGSPRFSEDVDIFHDVERLVAENAAGDCAALATAGFTVELDRTYPSFHRAWVGRDGRRMKIEWVADSAFRFFPAVTDPVLGYRLHDADLAVNKVLAGAGRVKFRDYVDLIHLDESGFSLGALAWAATGKDPGLAPLLVLNEVSRNARYYRPEDLGEVRLARPVTVQELKERWLGMLRRARQLVESLPEADVGCLYLDAAGRVVTPDPAAPEFAGLTRHFGRMRGSWPRVVTE
jgi:PAS domain-containing protein